MLGGRRRAVPGGHRRGRDLAAADPAARTGGRAGQDALAARSTRRGVAGGRGRTRLVVSSPGSSRCALNADIIRSSTWQAACLYRGGVTYVQVKRLTGGARARTDPDWPTLPPAGRGRIRDRACPSDCAVAAATQLVSGLSGYNVSHWSAGGVYSRRWLQASK